MLARRAPASAARSGSSRRRRRRSSSCRRGRPWPPARRRARRPSACRASAPPARRSRRAQQHRAHRDPGAEEVGRRLGPCVFSHSRTARASVPASSRTPSAPPATSSSSAGCPSTACPPTTRTRSSSSAARCIPTRRSGTAGSGPSSATSSSLLERGTPMLGVCLGSQLIARAAGARVFRADEPEVGWLPVELTEAAAADPVASSLPAALRRVPVAPLHARPPRRRRRARAQPQSARRRSGSGSAWGVQFHPEVRAEQVEAWLAEDPDDVADPPALRAATRERIEAWNELGRRLCSAFLAVSARAPA